MKKKYINKNERKSSAWTAPRSSQQSEVINFQPKGTIYQANKRKIVPVDPPDGGWGWLVCFAFFLSYFVVTCVRMNFSVVFPELLKEFGTGAGPTSWITSVELALCYITGPFVAVLCKKYGNRSVVVGGSVLSFIGLWSSVFATNGIYMIMTYGVLTGIANCATFMPTETMVGRYFHIKHPIAQGIGATGTGIATFLMPPFAHFLKVTYGWRGALLIVSGLSLHTLVAACLLRPIYLKSDEELQQLHVIRRANKSDGIITEQQNNDTVAPMVKRRSSIKIAADYVTSIAYYSFDIHLFKNRVYLLTIIAFVFFGMGTNVTLIFTYVHAINIGIEDSRASFLLSAFGLAFIISAIIQGFVLHRVFVNFNRAYVFLTSLLVQGASIIFLGFARNYYIMIFCISLEGFTRGIFVSLNPVVLKQVVGEKYFITGIGMSYPFFGIGQLISPPISGYLYDITGSYTLSFCATGCSILLGFLILAPGHVFLQKKEKKFVANNASDSSSDDDFKIQVSSTSPARKMSGLREM